MRSTRLAIVILVLLVVAIAIGGVLPQVPTTPNADLIYESYSPFWRGLIHGLALDDVFHSIGFSALLALLALNLVLCTAGRVPRGVRAMLRPAPPSEASRGDVEMTVEAREVMGEDLDTAIRRALRRHHLRVQDVGCWLLAERHRWSRLGADLVHASLLLILVGAFLGVYQLDGYFAVNEAERGRIVPFRLGARGGTFGARVDSFGAELYSGTQSAKDYWTRLSFVEDGVAVATLEARVNRPAVYRGVSFYQMAYGDDLDAAHVSLAVIDSATGTVIGRAALTIGEMAKVPSAEIEVQLVRFFTHIRRTASGSLLNASGSGEANPAALLAVRPLKGGPSVQTLAFASVPPHPAGSPYALALSGFAVPKYVGIRYARNPGYPIVWAGLALMMVGLTAAFYLPARRLWVSAVPEEGHVRLSAEHATARDASWANSVRRTIDEELQGVRKP